MNTFYTKKELESIGLKNFGEEVYISRNAILYHPGEISVENHVRIDDYAILSGKITIGSYVHIAQFAGLYGGDSGIFMGDFTSVSSKVSIYAVSDDFSGESMTNPMVPMEFKPGWMDRPVILEKFVAVGASSVILPGVTLKIGSAFSAMGLIIKDSEPFMVYAGMPARRVADRKKNFLEFYEKGKTLWENSSNI